MTSVLLDPSEESATSPRTTDLGLAVTRPVRHFGIPTSQLYYWTGEWQAGERETLEALQRGEGVRFPSGQAFADWLLQEDDDEPGTSDGD